MEGTVGLHVLNEAPCVDDSSSRVYYTRLVDQAARDRDKMDDLTTLLSTLSMQQLEHALPSLCLLAENGACPLAVASIAHSALIREQSSRGGRKAALAALKQLYSGAAWSDFFVLAQCLEEPQFHIIKPVLPRVDNLLAAHAAGEMEWRWIELIIYRAAVHTNGWIRVWALEKYVACEHAVIADNEHFLLSSILPQLNCTDSLWRLEEKKELSSFTASLGHLLHTVVEKKQADEKGVFVRRLLECLSSFGCPQSWFILSHACLAIRTGGIMGEDSVSLFRHVICRVQYIPYNSLRAASIVHFVQLFARLLKWTDSLLWQFAWLVGAVWRESPALLEPIRLELEARWRVDIVDPLDVSVLVEEIYVNRVTQDEEWCWLWWARATAGDGLQQLSVCVERALGERIGEGEGGDGTDSLIAAWATMPTAVSTEESLVQMVNEYVTMRLFSLEGTPADSVLVERVLCPLVEKTPQLAETLPRCIAEFVKQDVSVERHSLLSRVLLSCARVGGASGETVKEYLGDEPLRQMRAKKSIADLTPKQFLAISEHLHANRAELYLRFASSFSLPCDSLIECCVEQLDCSSSYARKERLLECIERAVRGCTSESVLSSGVAAAAAVVDEERKSCNCQPAIARLLAIALQREVLAFPGLEERVRHHFLQLLELAQVSTQVSLILARALAEAIEWIGVGWAGVAVRLSVFGPVPKKDQRVLTAVYEMIYKEEDTGERLGHKEGDRLHETIQRARFISVCAVLGRKDAAWTTAVADALLHMCTQLDTSSSKSFGLSLAHRQKTRAVELMLLLVGNVEEKDVLSRLFAHCVSAVVDPCQQFSIKLLVEWTAVCIALKDADRRAELVGKGKQMALTRIGSVASWLNMMLLLARAENTQDSRRRTISLLVPWTSAQNFGVRCSAIAACRLLYQSMSEEEQTGYELVKGIIDFDGEPAGNSRRIIENLCSDFYFAHLHPVDGLDMYTVMQVLPERTGLPSEETIPLHLLEELNASGVASKGDTHPSAHAPSLVYSALSKNNTCAPDMLPEDAKEEVEEEAPSSQCVPACSGDEGSLQRKIVTGERKRPDDCSIIVVASLVDKPANLGGLCRTSEIFGVDSLVVADWQLTKDKGFQALSMSAENWQKMDTCRPSDLLPFLEDLRAKGYTVIAAEQTTDSVPLHHFQFPKKCVLVVGDEKEGVPVRLLRCVDRTVEIGQLGQTRSLNVHVTAALFIAKYAEQRLL